MAIRKSSLESQLADGKLGLGPGRPEFPPSTSQALRREEGEQMTFL